MVIDDKTGVQTTIATPSGMRFDAAAADPFTNRIYVPSNQFFIIDGATDFATAHSIGTTWPWAVAVNPLTDTVFVTDIEANTLVVIRGA